MKNKISSNGIEYILTGDYYIPVLEITKEQRPIGKYGRMRRDYLKAHRPVLYNDLLLSGRLWTYLADLNDQAQARLFRIIEQMKKAADVTEELKAADQMAWVKAMNSIRNRAEGIVLRELVCGDAREITRFD